MKRKLVAVLALIAMVTANANPLLKKFNTPFATPPFGQIKVEHYEPAFKAAFEEQNKEIAAIVKQRSVPTFENTIEALEYSGERLSTVASIFFALNSAESNDQMMGIARNISPLLTAHSNAINANKALFQRIKHVYDKRESLGLNKEQSRLLEKTYEGFVHGGANLEGEARAEYDRLSMRLSELTTQFGQNMLKATNAYRKVITEKAQLKGFPETEINAAAARAKAKGEEGYVIDLSAPSYIATMKYAEERSLREELYKARFSQCANGGEFDNQAIAVEIANARLGIARLMGFDSYAAYSLSRKMAKLPENVTNLLDDLVDAYTPAARVEMAMIDGFAMGSEGKEFTVMPWDLSYYSNKLKEAKYNYNSEELRPYFELDNTIKGVFGLATELFGITFKENKKIPVYHPEVNAYEVHDADGKFLSVLYTDFFPRDGKRSGAWMTSYRDQLVKDGKETRPIITIVMNFSRPTESEPALLQYSEVETFLHEFGHALHGMLAATTYPSLSGTGVYRDFVELPSQIMENWLGEKAFLDRFAIHYKTKEQLPAELMAKMKASETYMAAYGCLRQVYLARLDMAFYNRTSEVTGDIMKMENEVRSATVPNNELPNYGIATTFSHIFAGGYSAGYYSYKWAEVLDADAFAAFQEKGIFNKEVAKSFRENILMKGGTEDPMELYIRFRGAEPKIDAMLKRDGIKQ